MEESEGIKMRYHGGIMNTPNWNGTESVPATYDYKHEKPFYFDGITFDEFLVEQCHYHTCIAQSVIEYKPLREQIIDGDIQSIPEDYKVSLPYPENCTAYVELLKATRVSV